MPVHLLDVNLLIALAWPNHVHHDRARDWFAEAQTQGWATCPITQCGFVRISSNPKVIREAVSPRKAIDLLRRMTGHPQHIFWPDDLELSMRHAYRIHTSSDIGRLPTHICLLSLSTAEVGWRHSTMG